MEELLNSSLSEEELMSKGFSMDDFRFFLAYTIKPIKEAIADLEKAGGRDTLVDDTTGITYKIGIENGMVFMQEVEETIDDTTGSNCRLGVDNGIIYVQEVA